MEIGHAWLKKGCKWACGGGFVQVMSWGLVMGKDEVVGGDRTCMAREKSLMVQVRKDASGEGTEMQKMVAWVRCSA